MQCTLHRLLITLLLGCAGVVAFIYASCLRESPGLGRFRAHCSAPGVARRSPQHSFQRAAQLPSPFSGGGYALARACFQHTENFDGGSKRTPSISSNIPPSDSLAHFRSLLNATAKYRSCPRHAYAAYNGPWIENHWISKFCCNKTLSEFGGMVPIFVQWVDCFVSAKYEASYTNVKMIAEISALLRPDVIYVTVSQGDSGIGCISAKQCLPNVLVLSSGGYGHVPIPLLGREVSLLNNLAPASKSIFPITFVGKSTHHEH